MLSKNLLDEIKIKSEELELLKPLSSENQAKLDKKFRLEFNYNSNHLEGNTLTYGETELLLIFDQTEGSHDFREYQEMQAHDVALKMVQEEATEIERPLTENFIRSLNEHILVKPFWKDAVTQTGDATRKKIIPGQYKTTPNSVRLTNDEVFHYTSPTDVAKEMAELIAWYNENRLKENAVVLASLLHYRFVRIHPFDDGNGRTARLLMNYVLVENNLPLVVIKSTEKKEYLAALHRADVGDLKSFVEYIGEQLLWSLDLSITAAKGGNIDEDGDLDKELELLKRDVKQIPDEYDKKKSDIEVSEMLDKSIIPLYYEIESKLEKIRSLFVEINNHITVLVKTGPHNFVERKINSSSINSLYKKDYLFSPFEDLKIEKITLNINCIALKKASEQTNVNYKINIEMSEYHYFIQKELSKESIIKLPFGRFFTNAQINTIVKFIMDYIINEIRLATNKN